MNTARTGDSSTGQRLESWKAIANYLNRDVRTVQRWEKDEGLPVHRHHHNSRATVYAFEQEIDAWRSGRPDQQQVKQRIDRRGARIVAFAVAALLVGIVLWQFAGFQQSGDQSVAGLLIVLPFEDLSRDPLDPLADALTVELGSQLAAQATPELDVIARASAISLKGQRYTLSAVREQFGVDYALEGTIRSDGDVVRIDTQLVAAESGIRLWSETFEYPNGNWLDIQQFAATDILPHIGEQLGLDLAAKVPVRSMDANVRENVLLGWQNFDQFRGDTLPIALRHFEAAHRLDSGNVDAMTGLAFTHATMAFMRVAPESRSYEAAEYWASKILAIEASNSDALALLGWVEFVYRWNWSQAHSQLEHAVAAAANSPWPYLMLANFQGAMGLAEESIDSIDKAVRLDPGSPFVLATKGYLLNHAGMHDAAIEHWLAVRGVVGEPTPSLYLRYAYEGKGEFGKAAQLTTRMEWPFAEALNQAVAEDGEPGYWRVMFRIYADRIAGYPDNFSWPYAEAAAAAGETELALEMLERGYYQHDGRMVFLPVYRLESLYGEPRFASIVQRMGLQDRFPTLTSE